MFLQYQLMLKVEATCGLGLKPAPCEIVRVQAKKPAARNGLEEAMTENVHALVFTKHPLSAMVVRDCEDKLVYIYAVTIRDLAPDVFAEYVTFVRSALGITATAEADSHAGNVMLPDILELEPNKYFYDGNVLLCERVWEPEYSLRATLLTHRPYTRWYVNTNHVATLLVPRNDSDDAIMVYIDSATATDKSLLKSALEELSFNFSDNLERWQTWEHKSQCSEKAARDRTVLAL